MSTKKKVAPKHADGEERHPAVVAAQEKMEAHMTSFMATVGPTVARLQERLAVALTEQAHYVALLIGEAAAAPGIAAPRPAALAAADPAAAAAAAMEGAASAPAHAPVAALPTPAPVEMKKTIVDPDDGKTYEEVVVEFPNNAALLRQLRFLKKEAWEFNRVFEGIHDWIALNIPDMKEEDNVGVEVMGAVIEQLNSLNSGVRGVYNEESKYIGERADYEKALLKCPECATVKLQLEVGDAEEWDAIESAWRTLIRCCLILHSVLSKNMKKLRDPRGATTRHANMYS